MDVYCSSCNEPSDTFHLHEDLIYEVCSYEMLAEIWLSLPPSERLSDSIRQMFRSAGWEFGNSILDVRRCAGCPDDSFPDEETVIAKSAIVELLGNDEDAIAAAFEDFGL